MPGNASDLTEIERALFGDLSFSDESPFVQKFGFAGGAVSLGVVAMPGKRLISSAKFCHATIASVWLNEDEALEWPLDLMHFDCYKASAQRWKFVLNCGALELIWESMWPELSPNGACAPA